MSGSQNTVIARALTADEARVLTDRVKQDAAALWTKVLALYEGEAHVALGYASWAEYTKAELDLSKSQGYRLLSAARVTRSVAQSPMGERPANERVAREIARAEPNLQTAVWETAVMRHGSTPTAAQVRGVVDEISAPSQRPQQSVERRVEQPTARQALEADDHERQGLGHRTPEADAYLDRLRVVESVVCGLKQLEWPPPPGTFDAAALRELHRRISRSASELSDLESWLGKVIASSSPRRPADQPAPCGKPGHRADWRLRAQRAQPPGPWRCRICTPCHAAAAEVEWRAGMREVAA